MFGHKKQGQPERTRKVLTGEDIQQLMLEQAAGDGALTMEQEVGDAFELGRTTGSRARATIVAVEPGSTSEFGSVWRMKMTVQVTSADAFDAELAILYLGGDHSAPWKKGDVAPIVFDPADRSRVRFLPPSLQAAVRWRLPAICPSCGAPVDQATEALVDRPTCRFCSQPLPADPLG